MRDGEIGPFQRRQNKAAEGLKSYLSKLRLLRKRGAELASMPPEVISHLDMAIEILKNDHAMQSAELDLGESGTKYGAKK